MTIDAGPGPDDTRERIVEAAARLLREHGARALTTRAVARAAAVQAPAIYRLFGDKDGLVEAVAEHVMATYVAAKRAAAASTEVDPVTDLREGWRMHVDFCLANPELHALLGGPARSEPSPATRAGIEVLRARLRRLASAGLLRVDEDRALGLVRAAGAGTVTALLETPAARRDPGLAEAVLDAVTAAILTPGAAPDDGRGGDDRLTTAVVTLAALLPELPALTDAERTLMGEWLARSLRSLRSLGDT
ncbi:TetR/AcrR family transcriptional regulator [Nocardioides rubriscoriae]|uniref:TetR/AcrR family transcriptional regulator n=1 Tax=Nocardioides rubriscoriae TaxID=642762 RepID=UPI0011E0412C|nr:TetR/AcrR family transcriptional regulator [Nocardioides rubriscoriae]